jgi:ATP-dependent protease HslVU (ClpYQ) peptidase subunit
MTCIVGWIEGNDVWMGADSAGVAGLNIRTREDEKIFVKDEMIFGFTSSFRMGQLLRYMLQIPEQSSKKDDYQFMCSDFIDAVIKCLEKNKYAKIRENEISGGTFLVGYKGNLYVVENDFQVGKINKGYDSCGCGENYALGALHAMEGQKVKPEERINRALEAAQEFSAGVRGPFNILKLEGKEK